jgi:Fur family transcriptional regulator, zinc uptake regulator
VAVTVKPSDDRAEWVAQVEAICARRGLQLSPTRRGVLEALARSNAPLGAYAIIERLSQAQAKIIAPPTVYRALEFLVENGFVFKIASTNAFAPCDHLGHHHHGLLLICSHCGRADEIESPDIDALLAKTAAKAGFRPQHQVVEIEGLCGLCGDGAKAAKTAG